MRPGWVIHGAWPPRNMLLPENSVRWSIGAGCSQSRWRPVHDVYARNLRLREDGRLVNDMLLVRVKPMQDRTSEREVFKIVARVPGAEGIRSLAEGNCSLVK